MAGFSGRVVMCLGRSESALTPLGYIITRPEHEVIDRAPAYALTSWYALSVFTGTAF